MSFSHVAAHSLFTWQPPLKLLPLRLQLADTFSHIKNLVYFLCDSSHGDHCLCCHGKPLSNSYSLGGRGLNLLVQSAAAVCSRGVSSAVLQPLRGGDRGLCVEAVIFKRTNWQGWLRVLTCAASYSFPSPSPLQTFFSTVSVYSNLCNLGDTHTSALRYWW